jgi:hypothetical protein
MQIAVAITSISTLIVSSIIVRVYAYDTSNIIPAINNEQVDVLISRMPTLAQLEESAQLLEKCRTILAQEVLGNK